MLLIRGNNPNKRFKQLPAVVTIGSFDGLHTGHQYLFNQMAKTAETHNQLKVLITFEPRPQDYFNKKSSTNRLTLFADKFRILQSSGFDLIWVMNFNSALASMTAAEFLERINQVLQIQQLFIGSDFKFGKNRAGDLKFLADHAEKYHYQLNVISNYLMDGVRVSSSEIRQLCLHATSKHLMQAKQFLGRYYGFSGRVLKGQQKGRILGFPTVNINVKAKQLVLPRGVYAVYITHHNKRYSAMANWGMRPTIAQKLELVLEAHIFNFNQDIYGKKVSIEFVARIRDEKKFDSIQSLQQQLAFDKDTTQDLFKHI